MIEDDDTLQMYIEESYEHLEDIESDLLTIEEAGSDFDTDLVNKVFRAAHSIKGGAGLMGLANIKKLAHKIESVLGMMRGREISPRPEVISTVLKAFDKLRFMIDDIENSETIDIDEHIVSLVGITTASLPNDQKESVTDMVDVSLPDGTKLSQVSLFDIEQAKKEGKFIYLVEYDLIHDIQRKNRTPLEVLKSLVNSGTIIQSMIDVKSVGTLDEDIPNRIPFYILFASVIEPEIIPSLFDVSDKYVHNITSDLYAEEPSPPETERQKVVPEPEETIAQIDNTDISESDIGTENDIDSLMDSEVPIFQTKQSLSQTSLRVNVSLLNMLMTLAGELVLSRNQLLQGLSSGNTRALELSSQRIDMVTSELQEAIMKTRMQSIANVFNKFPRVVRDLASNLGKQVSILIEGKNVELDKTIIESISDPLTHLVRNSVDHGIEHPEERRRLGKNPTGQIKLKAFHEAGQVNIEVTDDGRGMDGDRLATAAVKAGLISKKQIALMSEKEKIALIFLPGFSTAKDVTDVSGRGVGMDVVKTNLDRLGGIVDIESKVGKGTEIRIKLPLTLAIIPSQIISSGSERYAIPQVNLNELLRIPAAQIRKRIEKVGDAEVVRLRDTLLPLLNLSKILGVNQTFLDPNDKEKYPERRENIADRRSTTTPFFKTDIDPEDRPEEKKQAGDNLTPRQIDERRISSHSALNIAVVSAGTLKYGMIVDQLCDSEEIVIKPLGRHLTNCSGYAGATIMGDGRVALILDVAGLAQMAKLSSLKGADRVAEAALESEQAKKRASNKTSLLLFRNGEEEQFAVPLGLVERVEKIKVSSMEDVGGKRVIQYRGGNLPLFSLGEVTNVKPLPKIEEFEVVVFALSGREIGLLVTPPVDAIDIAVTIDSFTLKQPGIMGSSIINGYTTLMVDIFEAVKIFNPDWVSGSLVDDLPKDGIATILFAEDSEFFRNQVKGFLQDEGYRIIVAEDGEEAFDLLKRHSDEIDIIVTDIEMPKMDGFEFTAKVRADNNYSHLKIIALTSLAGDDDISKGKSAGIDDYQIKMNREKLIASLNKHLGTSDS